MMMSASMAAGSEQPLAVYLRALRRHWILVAAITALAGVVAIAGIARSSATYQASASILVSPLEQNNSNFLNTGVITSSGEPVRTVQTAAALVDSPSAAQRTAAAMGGGWTAAGVESRVTVTPLGQSDILDVTAQAGSGTEAARLANEFARAAVAYRASVVQNNIAAQISELEASLRRTNGGSPSEVNLAQQLATRIATLRSAQVGGNDPSLAINGIAQPPGGPTGAPHWLVVLLALIGGFAIGSVAALAVDFFNRRVRDISEAESLLGMPVLAAVPRVRGASSRGGITPPSAFTPSAFEQVRMLRVQLASRENAPAIMVTSAVAGDGKTTLSTSLAAAFAETGERVLLLDLDLRRPQVARVLGIKPPRAADLAEGSLADLLVDVETLPGVRMLPIPRSETAVFPTLLARLPKLLDEAELIADRVIIDAAPVVLASESLEIARMSDQVILAVMPGHTDRDRLLLARDLLTRAHAPVVGAVAMADRGKSAKDYGYGYGTGAVGQPPEPPASSPRRRRSKRPEAARAGAGEAARAETTT